MRIKTLFISSLTSSIVSLLLISSNFAIANEVEVVDVKATQAGDKTWSFRVTLKHEDEGWDHYANEWQVIAPDNKILATRTLYHPHIKEQPFTRGTQGVKIPMEIKTIRIIAKDTVHGLSANALKLNLKTKKTTSVTLFLKKAK